jgi:hypothetical protein
MEALKEQLSQETREILDNPSSPEDLNTAFIELYDIMINIEENEARLLQQDIQSLATNGSNSRIDSYISIIFMLICSGQGADQILQTLVNL